MGSKNLVLNRRAVAALSRPNAFLKYVLVRARVAGFPVTPARAEDLARALAGVSPAEVVADGIDPVTYYRDIFAAFLAQDPMSYARFKEFWDSLWYERPIPEAVVRSAGGNGIDDLADRIAGDILRKMAGTVQTLPPEVIEE